VVIEQLGARARDDDPVATLVDFERMGTVGHSLGAATAIRSSGIERKIDAVVAHSPPGYLLTWREVDVELEDLGIPVFIQAGRLDETLPPENPRSVFEHLSAPAYSLELETAGHFTFSDLCILSAGAIAKADEYGVGNVLEDGCGPENLPASVALPLVRAYSIGFFNRFLRHSEGSAAYLEESSGTELVGRAGEVHLELKR
jgi:predicted dienelactone hydrolase